MCVITFTFPCVVQADTVWLINGDRLSGTVQSLHDGVLELKTNYAGLMKINWTSVSTMESESQISIGNNKTKEKYPASFSPYNAGYVVIKHGDKKEIVSIRRLDEFMKAEVRTDEWDWSGNIDADVNLKNASSRTDDYTFSMNTKFKKEKWRHDVSATYNREVEDESVNTDNYSFRYAFDYMFEEKYFWQSRLSYKRDWVEDLSRQFLIGTGPGYQLWDDDTGAFSVSFLAGAFSYGYSDDEQDSHLGATLHWDYQRFLIDKTITLYSNGELGHSLDNEGVISVDAELGVRYALTTWSTFHVGYHRNIVRGTRDTLDERVFSTGLGMTWK
ncbi:DUF481 domain-containing protein [Enterobacteriaceae bacterium RIT702]|nr:DUF481 domain-containing protein [Enterobacteriaceae bacterium RIT702]